MREFAILFTVILAALVCVACQPDSSAADAQTNRLEVWHTYSADGVEEAVFEETIEAYRAAHPEMDVEVVRVPFSQTVMQFIPASQGGEAPDLIRGADSHLTQIGVVSVNGGPLLEDLRPHYSPRALERFIPSAIEAMRMDNALLAIPVSQSTMSLLYNPALFERHNIEPPDEDWTLTDFVAAAQAFEGTGADGLAVPLRWTLWVMPFMTAHGGDLFDAEGEPRFSADGMAEALEFTRALEFDLALVNSANQIDAAKSKFARGEAAMIIEGVWNLEDYRDAGIDVRQALLPSHPDTGLRMRPLNTVIGWGVSSQSANKPAAADLALRLSSDDAQRLLLEKTLTLPSSQFVKSEALSGGDQLISGFIRQSDLSFTMPMRPRVQQIFLVIDTAIELFISGKSDAESALSGADEEMRAVMAR